MKVLAIDPGSEKGMGWALMDSNGLQLLASGVVFTGTRPAHWHERDRSNVWSHLLVLLEKYGVRADVIAYEDVVKHSSVWAAHLYGGQQAHIQFWCHAHDKSFQPVPVATVKRFLRSSASGAEKVKAQVEAAHRLGYSTVQDHNEADAVGIALGAIWLQKQNQSAN